MSRIACCIVTMNRKKELIPCLDSCLIQDHTFDRVIVLDNLSTDGTQDYLRQRALTDNRIEVIYNSENTGCSAGFAEILRKFIGEYDYFYLIDDDVVLEPSTLAGLVQSPIFAENTFGFLSSLVLDYDTKKIAPMNFPWISFKDLDSPRRLQENTLPARTGSFVGMLVSARAIIEVGLPIKEFFIYADDYEFSMRISKRLPCFLLPASIAYHKGKSVDFCDVPLAGLWKHYHATRNLFYAYKTHRNLVLYFGDRAKVLVLAILKKKLASGPYISTIIRGIWDGLFFNPEVEHITSRNYPPTAKPLPIQVL